MFISLYFLIGAVPQYRSARITVPFRADSSTGGTVIPVCLKSADCSTGGTTVPVRLRMWFSDLMLYIAIEHPVMD